MEFMFYVNFKFFGLKAWPVSGMIHWIFQSLQQSATVETQALYWPQSPHATPSGSPEVGTYFIMSIIFFEILKSFESRPECGVDADGELGLLFPSHTFRLGAVALSVKFSRQIYRQKGNAN